MTAFETLPRQAAGDRATEVFRIWLTSFSSALESGDGAAVADCFVEDGYWRDILTFGWECRTYSGIGEIRDGFARALLATRPGDVRVAADRRRDEGLAAVDHSARATRV
jgi:putative flavoprotein involved in K+ transport